MERETDERQQVATTVRGSDPMFDVKLELTDDMPIPENEIHEKVCPDFLMPPSGQSHISEFDLLVHLEIEPEQVEVEDKGSDESSEPEENYMDQEEEE